MSCVSPISGASGSPATKPFSHWRSQTHTSSFWVQSLAKVNLIRGELLQGTLDLLVLRTLAWGPRHGYGIARWLEDTTDDALKIAEGSLYPALYRMQDRGWVESAWGTSELGKRIKIYALTELGRAQLTNEADQWNSFVATVARVMASGAQP